MTYFSRIGFDAKDRMLFAIRTALAAVVALIIAWQMGLEHPQWAAMSVWAGSQPLRGQLLEKGLLRIIGTIIGTLAGIVLVQIGLIHPALLVLGLGLWMALCTGLNNLLRGFIAYGAVLAGYTAAMVALLEVENPENVLALGLDRFLTVITGVGVAMLVGLIFAPRADTNRLRRSMRELAADVLEHLSQNHKSDQSAALLARIAAAEEGLDPHAAGSLRSHAEIKAARMVLISLVAFLLRESHAAGAQKNLLAAASALREGDIATAALALEDHPEGLDPQTKSTLHDLASALEDWVNIPHKNLSPTTPLILHRDWIGAREASMRAFSAILIFGAIWQLTGWSAGNFMLLGLSIMVSLFSSFESPTQMLKGVVIGQIMGISAVLACRWLVWPYMGSEAGLIFSLIPFILAGALVAGNRHTAGMSFDYNMLLLLLSQPVYPLTGTFLGSVATGLSVLSAPIVAFIFFKTVFPINLKRRIETLEVMIAHDLSQLARDPMALSRRMHWRARLYHRTLRLLRMSSRYGRDDAQVMSLALQTLRTGHQIMQLHQKLAGQGLSQSARRAAKLGLARAERIERDPLAAQLALERCAKKFQD